MKIALANDNIFLLKSLENMLNREISFQIVWIAHNGLEAVQNCKRVLPDILLMDIDMPIMNGIEATKLIMQNTPCPILIATNAINDQSPKVFEAMGHGALDAISLTTTGGEVLSTDRIALIKKILTIGRLKGSLHLEKFKEMPLSQKPLMSNGKPFPFLLTIGASTGGPVAISKVLANIPKSLPLSIIIIQHVDEKFIGGLTNWLSDQIDRPVKIAMHGENPEPRNIYLAAKNQHLTVRHNGIFYYTANPKDYPYTPSVDVFYSSLAEFWPQRSIAVLLTGMGNDGARGMKALKNKGWHTIAEDEASCVVYGMPRAAIELGGVEEIVLLDLIAQAVVEAFNKMT